MIKGRINSFQSLGTLDGPGVRFVVFMQGCPLRCCCCHNPETQPLTGGEEYTAEEVINKALRYKNYFGDDGGITVSGGEPLMQSEFVSELFILAHENGINTCLDTSGCILDGSAKELYKHTDYVLLDIKYTNDDDYRRYVGCSIEAPIRTLEYLSGISMDITLRQVIFPELNGDGGSVLELKAIADKYNASRVELLPFKKICQSKYDALGLTFPFADIDTPTAELMQSLQKML